MNAPAPIKTKAIAFKTINIACSFQIQSINKALRLYFGRKAEYFRGTTKVPFVKGLLNRNNGSLPLQPTIALSAAELLSYLRQFKPGKTRSLRFSLSLGQRCLLLLIIAFSNIRFL
jgi:hypothetical protein